jgi:hypothetical protein
MVNTGGATMPLKPREKDDTLTEKLKLNIPRSLMAEFSLLVEYLDGGCGTPDRVDHAGRQVIENMVQDRGFLAWKAKKADEEAKRKAEEPKGGKTDAKTDTKPDAKTGTDSLQKPDQKPAGSVAPGLAKAS